MLTSAPGRLLTSVAVFLVGAGVTGTLEPLMNLFNAAGVSEAANPGDSLTYKLTSSGTRVVVIEDNAGPGIGDFTIASS
jgi:hypothetical protein